MKPQGQLFKVLSNKSLEAELKPDDFTVGKITSSVEHNQTLDQSSEMFIVNLVSPQQLSKKSESKKKLRTSKNGTTTNSSKLSLQDSPELYQIIDGQRQKRELRVKIKTIVKQ